MALEQYKTQVLLLHSQQSTLDKLGASFSVSEKYSVHYATSGTEALNTLGQTPIHVLVSAQDLPGMSGLEALREAKKRSPDTIGILLAGSDRDDGLEALVGDKEVFQIVRGAITPDALLNIIENATKRVRMLAISESANDTAADVDWGAPESTGEHIVMETAENGATIISDGTGRLPALRPERIQAQDTGGREVDVLVLTKDEEFLNTVKDSSRGLHNVHHAVSAAQAQEIVRNHKVGVLVTDAAVAGSKIQALTQALRRDVPRLVAVVAGRRDDGELLMDLINRGQVYRFLLKPVSPGRTRLAIEASVKHHLEAPDAAFGGAGRTAAPKTEPQKPAARPAATAAPKPAAKPAPKPAPKAAPKPEPKTTTKPTREKADDLYRTGSRKTPVIKPIAAGDAPAEAPDAGPMGLRDDSLGDESSSKMPLIAGAAAAIVLLAGGIWFFAGGSPEEPATPATAETGQPAEREPAPAATEPTPRPAVTEANVSRQVPRTGTDTTGTAAATEPAAEPAYASFLEDARLARDSGRLIAPPGDNAVEHYLAALEVAPDNEAIAEELAALAGQVLAMVEAALLENRVADADAALEMIALADPENPRLAFLTAQVSQLQQRAALDEARLAIRENRFEDAAVRIDRARSLGGAPAEIDLLAQDLAAARSAQQVGDVLALANARLAEDRLIAPSNDNARYYYQLTLSNAPDNAAAQQGLVVVASKLVLRAREAIDAGELETATTLLAEAAELDADSSGLEASATALESAKERRAAAERQAAIARQEAARQAEAERRAALRRRTGASATLTNAPDDAAPAPLPAGGSAASFAPAMATDAATDAGSAVPEGAGSGEADGASGEGAQAGADEPPFLTISELVRVNYAAPEYPRSAQRRNISGWVEVSFTVTPQGTVDGIEIMDSMPGSVFDDAATEAVGKWRFEPVVEDGLAVPKRAAVRLAFTLE